MIRNPTTRWINFKTTHQLVRCTQNHGFGTVLGDSLNIQIIIEGSSSSFKNLTLTLTFMSIFGQEPYSKTHPFLGFGFNLETEWSSFSKSCTRPLHWHVFFLALEFRVLVHFAFCTSPSITPQMARFFFCVTMFTPSQVSFSNVMFIFAIDPLILFFFLVLCFFLLWIDLFFLSSHCYASFAIDPLIASFWMVHMVGNGVLLMRCVIFHCTIFWWPIPK